MRIACIGGGPAGLYFAISMKLRDPAHDIVVYERNRPGDTFGWGVVLSDQAMDNLRANDPASAAAIAGSLAHWDDIDVHFRGTKTTSGGHGFSGIGRRRLLQILQDRARALGVELRFDCAVDGAGIARLAAENDLVVAADGIGSAVRAHYAAAFEPDIDVRRNRYVWLGTPRAFDAFTFMFEQTAAGWIWAHAYRFEPGSSTFIVECGEDTWRGLGLDTADGERALALCERIFRPYLDGHRLMDRPGHSQRCAWISFPRVSCERWFHGNVVLMGDAAHSAHFSIGSGTRLAFDDAIHLSQALAAGRALPESLQDYQGARRLDVLRLQSAARNSTEWFEDVERYVGLEPPQFVYSLLTRSQRIGHENLRLRDPRWLDGVERWFHRRATGRPAQRRVPPMFVPFRLRGMEVANRVVVSPMSMYSAEDGTVGDWHLVHYGARAEGGAGLLVTEMTDVSREGRIGPGCAGMYGDGHVAAWKRIVDFVHGSTEAKFALQLGHAGPKGSTQFGWQDPDAPLPDGNWPLIAPSPVPWSPRNQVPRAMTRDDMDIVTAQFVRAAQMAEAAGFDMLELHCAHGYLLSAFITPLMNRRTDRYGGSLENRLRFPLEVFRAVRAAWPADRPLAVRISANDWMGAAGIAPGDASLVARAFGEAGCDIVDVSAGQTSPDARPVYGRMFQTPFSDRIRHEAGIPTMAVGNIYEADHVNAIVMAGRADLVCLARPHLSDPNWTLRAAAQQGYDGVAWQKQYLPGRDQLVRLMARGPEPQFRV